MKILIVNPILYTSETDEIPKVKSIKDTMIYTLCRGFLENGDEPVLIAADSYKPIEAETYPFRVIWFPCGLPKICKPRCLPLLKGFRKFLKQERKSFDYIIASEVFSLTTLICALFAKEKTMIWHELGAHNNLMNKIPSKVWYNIMPRLFMRNIPIIPRSCNAQEFIRHYATKVSATIIDHGVDIQKIECSAQKENYFVVVSQLIERKQIDGIIDTFTQFYHDGYEIYSLKIIGDGILRETLAKQVKHLGMQDSIQFYGSLSHQQLAPILMSAKALLVNTKKDNNMVSIVESIAAGTPVISTDVPFNASYIQAFDLGIVKAAWGVNELIALCQNNAAYVANCLAYRDKLSNSYCAEAFKRMAEQNNLIIRHT